MRALVLVAAALAACGTPAADRGRPSPSVPASAPATSPAATSPAATPFPSPSPTPQPNPTAGPATYTSIALAYRVDIPTGWRRSACQSTRGLAQPPGTETFTVASVDEESGTDMGAAQDIVEVHVESLDAGQTALSWLQSGRLGQWVGTHYEPATLDGKDAARWIANDSGTVIAFAIAARGNVYVVWRGLRGLIVAANGPASNTFMASIHVLSDAELATARATLATPTPTAPRSAEDVADTLARGFAQKDTTVLASVASPCLTSAYEQAGPSMSAASKVMAGFARDFANGLVVTVRPRPLVDQRPGYAAIASIWTGGGQPDRSAKLMLVSVGNAWYWDGWIFAQPVR